MVPCTKKIIILQLSLAFCLFYFFYPAQTIARTPVASISQNLNLLEQLSRETNKNVLALLSLIKEFEKHAHCRRFNSNHSKFVNEMNDRNELIIEDIINIDEDEQVHYTINIR